MMEGVWRRLLLPMLLVLVAFGARTWQLRDVPPGWSDDELSNIFVISQKVFQGDTSVYYTDATGLEALYHVVSGVMLKIFGFNVIGIRLLSALLGTLTVPLTYQVGRRLFNRRLGLLAAAALTVSFWSLIYSRVNLRHISLPVLGLLVFYYFWKGITAESGAWRMGVGKAHTFSLQSPFIVSGFFLGLSLYTYFAARGIPLILLAFVLYLALFDRGRLRRRLRGVAMTFLLAGVLALPLLVTVQQKAGADARVAEVAVPLMEAREGNFEPLIRHVRVTLSMFHGDGDDEYLYNIPHRPVFGAPGAVFLWLGVLTAAWMALGPVWRKPGSTLRQAPEAHLAAALLLLWWAAGITPGFLSVPAASLGHTILAQPATYLLFSLPLLPLSHLLRGAGKWRARTLAMVGLLLVASVALRDLPDYFTRWAQQGFVRFLYHADAGDVAHYLAQQDQATNAATDFAISGLLAGPWDRLALALELQNAGVAEARPRWYHVQRAVILSLSGKEVLAFSGYPEIENAYSDLYQPLGPTAGDYHLAEVNAAPPAAMEPLCFRNGLCLLEATFDQGDGAHDLLHLTWRVKEPLQLPQIPLYSKPPPPDVYDGPRLLVFAQRWDAEGNFLGGDDGLWVDPLTLHVGDVFRQQHHLPAAPGELGYTLFGLYDPMNGQRILTVDGRNHVRLEIR